MKRLTKKCKDENGQFYAPYTDDVGDAIENVIFQKLGKLEDLEEQIGMSLEDFYKCVTHNDESFFIIEMNDDSEELEIIEVFKEDGYMHNYSCGKFMFCGHTYDTNEIYYEISFDNYGKDLFLTYEDAEKKLEEMKNEKKEN